MWKHAIRPNLEILHSVICRTKKIASRNTEIKTLKKSTKFSRTIVYYGSQREGIGNAPNANTNFFTFLVLQSQYPSPPENILYSHEKYFTSKIPKSYYI